MDEDRAQSAPADTIFVVNQKLSKYTLLEPIGEGGMGQVYRARMDGAHGFEKEVAIKRLREAVARGETFDPRALINEGRIGGQLQHPNVVEVFELGEHDGSLFIAMELIDGVALSKILRSFRANSMLIPVNVALDIAAQACRGLAYAHNYERRYGKHEPVVHRDLKPSNIMVTTRGITKILDFGIARSESSEMATTDSGVAKGTPLYMSPEHLAGIKPFPAQADIFSLGVILYELATGKLLFGAGSLPEIIGRVQWLDLDKATAEADAAIPGLGEILNECLNRRIEMRWRDVHEGSRLLDGMARQAQQMTSTEDFIHRFMAGRYERTGPRRDDKNIIISDSGSISQRAEEASVVAEDTPLSYAAIPGQEDFDEDYYQRRRHRRGMLMTLWLLAMLSLVAGLGAYVYRATLGVALVSEEAEQLLADGDMSGALRHWEEVLQRHGGRPDARIAIAAIRGRPGGDVDRRTDLDSLLKRVSDGSVAEFVRRQRAFALLQRRFGYYKLAHGVLREALDRLYQGKTSGGGPLPPALLWESAELALILRRDDEAKRSFQELSRTLPPSAVADAAAAYVQAIDAGQQELLRLELLWLDRRLIDQWHELPGLLNGKAKIPGWLARQRAVWAQRALAEEHYQVADSIASKVRGADQRSRYTVQAAARAGQGHENDARKALAMALSFAPTHADQAASHAQVAQAAIRGGCSAPWIDDLLDQLSERAGPHDADLRYLRGLRSGQVLMLSTWAADGSIQRDLWLDPRDGRFYLPGLERGGPGSARLIGSNNFGRDNRSRGGSAWPFGPSFHPIDATPLQQFFHPGR